MRRLLVLADDFSGAAEIAGIGRRYGLGGVIVRDDHVPAGDEPLVVMDTDSRALVPEEAGRRVHQALQAARVAGFNDVFFKKIDSVLRGPVVAEVTAAMAATSSTTALVVPANPSRKRVIRNGHYYINDVPLHQTEFGREPEYPATTAHVVERVGGGDRVFSAASAEVWKAGIVIGDVETPAAMRAWAASLSPGTLAVGGADFFAARLEQAGYHVAAPAANAAGERASLLMCGTASPFAQTALQSAQRAGATLCPMPRNIFEGTAATQELATWRDHILEQLRSRGRAIASIGHPVDAARRLWVAQQLTAVMAATLAAYPGPCEIFAEGGTTASHLARQMHWHTFTTTHEYAPGVTQLAVSNIPNRWLTLKPGSYPWPPEIWTRLQ